MSQTRFHDEVILITGGTGALGSAVSCAFLREGARVAVTYRDSRQFEQLQHAAGEGGASRLEGWRVDVTNEGDTQRAVAALEVKLRRIDALVHTVGGYEGGTKLWQTDPTVLDRMLALNVRANSILPNVIDTAANRKDMPQADFTSWSRPEDIARVIMFLCSPEAQVIDGAAIPV